MNNSKRTSGFSLIELLAAIGIIAALGCIIVPVLSYVTASVAKTKDVNNMRQIAMSVLTFHAENNVLPGKLNRAVRVYSAMSETDSSRDRWFSTYMVDRGYLPESDELWSPPADYGIAEGGHNYILNNTRYSSPSYFFGYPTSPDPADDRSPRRLIQLKSNIEGQGLAEEPMEDIWMMTNLDGENYNSVSTAGSSHSVSGQVLTPWGGRHYAYFDGRVAFVEPSAYPSRD